MEFILENLASIIVLIVVAVIVGTIVFKLIRDKKAGKCSCGCGCNGCPNSGNCHGHQ